MCPPNPSAIRKKMALLETLHEPEADDVFIERSHAVEIIDTQGDLPQPPDARRSLFVHRWLISLERAHSKRYTLSQPTLTRPSTVFGPSFLRPDARASDSISVDPING